MLNPEKRGKKERSKICDATADHSEGAQMDPGAVAGMDGTILPTCADLKAFDWTVTLLK